MEKTNLYLMGQKGYSVLRALVENKLQGFVNQVAIGRDKGVSNDFSKEIADLCEENSIVFCHWKKGTQLESAEYSMAVSWKWLIGDNSKLMILHDSLLPKYRGFAPLINQLINGEKQIGVTAVFAGKEYDKGEIIAQEKTEIEYPIKIQEAIDKLSASYAQMAVNIMKKLFVDREKLASTPQNEAESSYSLWLDETDYQIDWNKPAPFIKRFIDSVGKPYKGASTLLDGKKTRVFSAEEIEDVEIENRHPGKTIFLQSGFPVVVCGKGLLKITEAEYEDSNESIFPLEKFRIRFK